LITPQQGLVKAGGQVVVTVRIEQPECTVVAQRNAPGALRNLAKDLLLIQTTSYAIEADTLLRGCPSFFWDVLAEQIKNGVRPKAAVKTSTLKCEFNCVADTTPSAAAERVAKLQRARARRSAADAVCRRFVSNTSTSDKLGLRGEVEVGKLMKSQE
jgi:hypothetical protein